MKSMWVPQEREGIVSLDTPAADAIGRSLTFVSENGNNMENAMEGRRAYIGIQNKYP